MHAGASKMLFQRAHALRQSLTHAEELLWYFLKTKPFGYKFRRQHPFSIYILDFYCHALQLVIEVDGGIHDEVEVKQNDKTRQQFLEQQGLLVVRFKNSEVVTKMENVISDLKSIISDRVKSL